MFEAKSCQVEVTAWRSRDVHHFWCAFIEKPFYVIELCSDPESIAKLSSHKRLAVTGRDELTPIYPLDLGCMGICNFPAAKNSDSKFSQRPLDNPQSTVEAPHSLRLEGPNPTGLSPSRYCTWSVSSMHARAAY